MPISNFVRNKINFIGEATSNNIPLARMKLTLSDKFLRDYKIVEDELQFLRERIPSEFSLEFYTLKKKETFVDKVVAIPLDKDLNYKVPTIYNDFVVDFSTYSLALDLRIVEHLSSRFINEKNPKELIRTMNSVFNFSEPQSFIFNYFFFSTSGDFRLGGSASPQFTALLLISKESESKLRISGSIPEKFINFNELFESEVLRNIIFEFFNFHLVFFNQRNHALGVYENTLSSKGISFDSFVRTYMDESDDFKKFLLIVFLAFMFAGIINGSYFKWMNGKNFVADSANVVISGRKLLEELFPSDEDILDVLTDVRFAFNEFKKFMYGALISSVGLFFAVQEEDAKDVNGTFIRIAKEMVSTFGLLIENNLPQTPRLSLKSVGMNISTDIINTANTNFFRKVVPLLNESVGRIFMEDNIFTVTNRLFVTHVLDLISISYYLNSLIESKNEIEFLESLTNFVVDLKQADKVLQTFSFTYSGSKGDEHLNAFLDELGKHSIL